ncbi:MAG: ATP-binding protein [Bacteroidetes bacterium]|nr:ATP-binding protein [Bacteroidota bacterium]
MTFNASHSGTINVPATTDHLHEIREFLRERIRAAGFSEFEENGIVLAVDEACSNLIRHAYHNDPTQSVEVSLAIESDAVTVRICDTATPFDPSSAEVPDMPTYLQERRNGGLGILIMRRVMDMIDYVPCGPTSNRNMLVLTKRRTA